MGKSEIETCEHYGLLYTPNHRPNKQLTISSCFFECTVPFNNFRSVNCQVVSLNLYNVLLPCSPQTSTAHVPQISVTGISHCLIQI